MDLRSFPSGESITSVDQQATTSFDGSIFGAAANAAVGLATGVLVHARLSPQSDRAHVRDLNRRGSAPARAIGPCRQNGRRALSMSLARLAAQITIIVVPIVVVILIIVIIVYCCCKKKCRPTHPT
jgi:hypothetical protein